MVKEDNKYGIKSFFLTIMSFCHSVGAQVDRVAGTALAPEQRHLPDYRWKWLSQLVEIVSGSLFHSCGLFLRWGWEASAPGSYDMGLQK